MEMKEQKIIMLIGIPGAGKTTFAKNLEGTYISPDAIRKERYGDISVQGNPVEVFSVVEERIIEAFNRGEDVIYDATNTTEYRRETIAEFRRYGFTKVIGIFVDTPLKVCLERNTERTDRKEPVPVEVISRMWNNLQKNRPIKEEGFDEFYVVL